MKRKSRKKKIVRLLSVIITLLLLYLGWMIYQFFYYEISEKELGVDADFFVFESTNNIQSNLQSNIDFNIDLNQENETNAIEEAPANTDSSNTIENSPEEVKRTPSPSRKKLSTEERVQQIEQIYYPQFVQLQNKAMERLQQLLILAKKEYMETKDRESFSEQEFATKYIAAAKKLQTGVDQAFYQLVDQMEMDLKNKNLPLNLVDDAKIAYKETIKSHKAELLKGILN